MFLFVYSVYSGHQSILIPPLELESSLPLWLSTLSQYKIRDTFCSYSVMELCTKGLGTQTEMLKVRIALTQSATWGFFSKISYCQAKAFRYATVEFPRGRQNNR